MSSPFVVRVRYCGGCNPEIERSRIVQEAAGLLEGLAEFTTEETAPADLLLHVNGCAHACLDEQEGEPGPEPVVSVQGLRVDREQVDEKSLAKEAAARILDKAGREL